VADGTYEAVLEALVDGTPVEWPAAPAVADPTLERGLRRLIEVARLHRTLSTLSSTGPDVPRRQTLPPLAPGEHWAHLRVLGLLGTGGQAIVYHAWDPRLEREVALKLLSARDGAHALREARMLARVRHPNVVSVHGAETLAEVTGIWMERLEGTTLAAEVVRRGPLPIDEVVDIGVVLCGALAAVHDAGLLHRDVKAQNVCRDTGGRLVLMDFGTARHSTRDGVPRGTDLTGTPLYLAPEVLGGAEASVQSDLYSLGVLLFHLLTGCFPVTASTVAALRRQHERRERTRLADMRPGVPDSVADVFERALAATPGERFADARAFGAALASTRLKGRHGSAPWSRWAFPLVGTTAVAVLALVASLRSGPAPGRGGSGDAATLIAQADSAIRSVGHAAALELANQAVTADPSSAEARIFQAYMLRNVGAPREAWRAAAQRALELSASLTGPVRTFVTASVHQMEGRPDDAEAGYLALLRQQPDHYYGLSNLAVLHFERGRVDEGLYYVMRRADLYAAEPGANCVAAGRLVQQRQDFTRARRYYDRFLAYATAEHSTPCWGRAAVIRALERQHAGDVAGAAREVEAVMRRLDRYPATAQDAVRSYVVRHLLMLGQTRRAAEVARGIGDQAFFAPYYRALVALARHEPDALRHVPRIAPYPGYMDATARLRIRAGLPDESATWPQDSLTGFAEVLQDAVRGARAATGGADDGAVEALERVVARNVPGQHARALADLAAIHLARGATADAMHALDRSWREDPRHDFSFGGPHAHDWMPSALLLARLYREQGRVADALPIEADLGRRLARADADFPLLERLRQLQAGSVPSP
jgi:tetratricopeptide (TPR) repeat protein